jgi:hypothetical protein
MARQKDPPANIRALCIRFICRSLAKRSVHHYAIRMPKGLKGERRPTEVVEAAIMVGKIATGETQEKSAKMKKDFLAGFSQTGKESCCPLDRPLMAS